MKCTCCGKEISSSDRFCPYCGQNNENYVEAVENTVHESQPRNNEYAGYRDMEQKFQNSQNNYSNRSGQVEQPSTIFVQNSYNINTNDDSESAALSVLALVFGLLGGTIALVFGIIGLCNNKKPANRARCVIGIIAWAVWVIVYIIIIATA